MMVCFFLFIAGEECALHGICKVIIFIYTTVSVLYSKIGLMNEFGDAVEPLDGVLLFPRDLFAYI